LSRRQRLLYDEYINSDKTKQTLNDSDFFSIMNVLMQLRKVCNHPDLFEARTIESPFIMQERVGFNFPAVIYRSILQHDPFEDINFNNLNFVLSEFEAASSRDY
jgi:E1A-binding protein p400